MFIYKIIAVVLILLMIISLVSGVLSIGNFDQNNIAQNSVVNNLYKQKFDFETLEIASTELERQVGYMNREAICAKCGMLFVFDSDQLLSFWMKDTLLPLRVIFIDSDNIVINTAIGQPYTTVPTIDSKKPAKYVLEVPINSPINPKENQKIDVQDMVNKGVKHSTSLDKKR